MAKRSGAFQGLGRVRVVFVMVSGPIELCACVPRCKFPSMAGSTGLPVTARYEDFRGNLTGRLAPATKGSLSHTNLSPTTRFPSPKKTHPSFLPPNHLSFFFSRKVVSTARKVLAYSSSRGCCKKSHKNLIRHEELDTTRQGRGVLFPEKRLM